MRTTPGLKARPTTDKIRQSIFNILMNDIESRETLDLFAGSGALGIEALSRGAASAVFVESGHQQARAIKTNLKELDLKADVLEADYKAAARLLAESNIAFDIIFADPPYERYSPADVAETVLRYNLLRPGGLFIIEHKTGGMIPEGRLNLLKRRRFGQTEVSFYVCKRNQDMPEGDLSGDL